MGCDHLLNSNKVIDRCGVCGGKADSCIDETADFTEQIASKFNQSVGNGVIMFFFFIQYQKNVNMRY